MMRSDTILMAYLVGMIAGTALLCLIGAVLGLGFIHILTLPAWWVGWWCLCWGVDQFISLREDANA